MQWEVEEHRSYDKGFMIYGPLPLEIDNDDVDSRGVAVLAQAVADCLNEHFIVPVAGYCYDDDCNDSTDEPLPLVLEATEGDVCPRCGNPLTVQEVFPA